MNGITFTIKVIKMYINGEYTYVAGRYPIRINKNQGLCTQTLIVSLTFSRQCVETELFGQFVLAKQAIRFRISS